MSENPLALFAKVERQADAGSSSVVTLNPAEIEVATVIGTYREKVSQERGFRDGSHGEQSTSLEQNVDAAGAELAASKATGCRWNMTVGEDLDEPDLWPHVEVRHTTSENGGLIVRPKDNPGRLFVLVIGTIPTYHVIGFNQPANSPLTEGKPSSHITDAEKGTICDKVSHQYPVVRLTSKAGELQAESVRTIPAS